MDRFICIISWFTRLGEAARSRSGRYHRWRLHLEGNFSITKRGMGLDCIWAVAKVSCVEKVLISFSLSRILMTRWHKQALLRGRSWFDSMDTFSRKRLYNIATMKKKLHPNCTLAICSWLWFYVPLWKSQSLPVLKGLKPVQCSWSLTTHISSFSTLWNKLAHM